MRMNQVTGMREQESGYPKELPLSLNLGPGPLAAVGERWGGGESPLWSVSPLLLLQTRHMYEIAHFVKWG